MRKVIILCCLLFLLCGCKSRTKASSKPTGKVGSITVALPQDDTVNGYRKSVSSTKAVTYYANLDTMKFHLSDCVYAKKTKADHVWITTDREALAAEGYEPCSHCDP